MNIALPASELALLVAMLLAGGVVMGVLAGLLGVGGGGIIVPILYEVFSVIGVDEAVLMHLCVGTTLAVIVPTSMRSYFSHKARGAVDAEILRSMVVPVVAGVVVGILVARFSDKQTLTAIWAGAAALISLKMYIGRESWRLGDEIPGQPWRGLYGVFIGTISTLMSIGGGAFVTMMMTLYGRTIHQAVATSSGFGPMIAIPGAIGFIWAGWGAAGLPPGSLGYVSLLSAAIIVPASVMAAPWGVRLAHRFSRRTLELAFATFLAVVAARFLTTLL